MNNVEAMKALLDGKKIRNKNWRKGDYFFIKNEKIVDENGGEDFIFNNNDVWEIVEEKKVGYINIYDWGDGMPSVGVIFNKEEDAIMQDRVSEAYIKTIKIEY